MAANIKIGIEAQDLTREGLSSAYNNVTKWTARMAKNLVLEVQTKFPDMGTFAQQFEKGLSKANSAIGRFQFLGERFGKNGKPLGDFSVDFTGLKGNLSLDKINEVLPKLRELQTGLAKGNIKSIDISGAGTEKEIKNLDELIRRLTVVKEGYEAVMRANSKRTTRLTSAAADIVDKDAEKQMRTEMRIAALKQKVAQVDKDIAFNATNTKDAALRRQQEINLLQRKLALIREINTLSGIGETRETQSIQRSLAALKDKNAELNRSGMILKSLRYFAMRYFSIFTVFNVARKMAEITGFFEQQRVALEGIFHSAEKARDAIEQIKQMALKSPFETKELIGGAKQLSAYGIDKNELLDTTKMIGDLSAGLGVSMDRLILAYGQVKSATVLRGQELRQFTEAGVPIVEKLAEKLSEAEGKAVGTKDVFEYISKRKVPFEMVASVLKDMTSEGGKFFNMQEELTDTLYGQMQKLKDVWTLALNDAGSSLGGFLRSIIEGLQQVAKHFRGIVVGGGIALILYKMADWYKSVRRITVATFDAKRAQDFYNRAVKMGIINTNIISQKTFVWAQRMRMVGVAIKAAVASLAAAAAEMLVFVAIGAIIGKITESIEKAKELKRALADVDSSIDKDVYSKESGLDALISKLKKAKIGTSEYEDALSALKSNYADYINPKYIDFLLQEGKAVSENADEWDRLSESIKKSVEAKAEIQKHREKADVYASNALKEFGDIDVRNEFVGTQGGAYSYGRIELNNAKDITFDKTLGAGEIKDIKSALLSAAENFFGGYNTTEEELKERITEAAERYHLSNDRLNLLLNNAELIFSSLKSSTDNWNDWIDEAKKALQKTRSEKILEEFEKSYESGREIAKGDWSKWKDVNSADFDPFFQEKQIYDKVFDSARAKFEGFGDESLKYLDATGKEMTANIKDVVYNGEKGVKRYKEIMETINESMAKLKENPIDLHAQLEYNNALSELGTIFANNDLAGYIRDIGSAIKEVVDLPSDELAVDVKEWMRMGLKEVYENSPNLGPAKFLPTGVDYDREEMVKSLRNTLVRTLTKYQDMQGGYEKAVSDANKELKQVKEDLKNLSSAIKKTRFANLKDGKVLYEAELKARVSALEYVTKPEGLYEEPKQKNQRTRRTREEREQVPPELVELFDKLKNAYETYKGATQQFGTGFGVDFMKGDEHMKDMFAEFFNGFQGKEFQELKTKKIGKHSNKTLYDVLQDKFIAEGLEDGVINFEKAALAVADELMHYYEGNTELRKNFKTYSETIRKWAYSISRDNLAARAEELKRTLSDITNTFQRTGQNIESFNKLVEKGTYRALGKELGVSLNDLLTPKSKLAEAQVRKIVEAYNKEGRAQASKVEGAKFTDIELGDLSTIEGIEKTIKSLDKLARMNDRNFAALEMGSISAEPAKSALNELQAARRAELEELSGDSFTGNGLADAIYNAIVKADSEAIKARKISTVSMAELGRIDPGALLEMQKANEEQAAKILEEFMSKYFLNKDLGDLSKIGIDIYSLEDTWAKMMEDMEKRLEEFGEAGKGILDEVRKKGEELRKNLRELATKTEPFKATVDEFNKFKNARLYAEKRYGETNERREATLNSLYTLDEKAGLNMSEVEEMYRLRSKTNPTLEDNARMEEIMKGRDLTPEMIDEYTRLTAVLADANAELEKMGENGAELAKQEQLAAINNMIAAYETIEKEVNTYAESFRATMEAIKGVVDFTEKFVDIMSDGEPPTWLSDTSAFLGDLIDGFNAVITTVIAFGTAYKAVMAAVAAASAGNPALLIIMGIAAAVAILMAAIQAHDRSVEHSIENIKDRMAELEHQMKILDAQAERMAGFDNFNARLETTAAKLQQASMNARMAELELSKKNADMDKYNDYLRESETLMQDFLNGLQSMRDELTQSFSTWADNISSSIRSAFQNGENAARNFKDVAMEMIGDIVENMLKMAILEPMIQAAMDQLLGGTVEQIKKKYTSTNENGEEVFDYEGYSQYMQGRLNDEKAMRNFNDMISNGGEDYINAVESQSPFLKEAYGWNNQTSQLSGGIQGITEDTARTLEGLSNSILAQNVQQTGYLQDLSQSAFATVQMSWFDGMLNLQQKIEQNTAGLNKAISDMRLNVQPMYVKIA